MTSVPETPKTAPPDFKGWPTWTKNLMRMLELRPQFVLSGNLRDIHLVPLNNGFTLMTLREFLWQAFSLKGFDYILAYDPVDGFEIFPPGDHEIRKLVKDDLKLTITDDPAKVTLECLGGVIRALPTIHNRRIALVIDYASHLVNNPEAVSEEERLFFLLALKQSHTAMPLNPVIWLAREANRLPAWLLVGNELIHALTVPQPDVETREKTAGVLAEFFSDHDPAQVEQQERFVKTFANLTNGMSLQGMKDISLLARNQKLPMADADDAVRCYKVGETENFWKKDRLKNNVAAAVQTIGAKIKGQERAVTKVVDILMRSAMGLAAAHASTSSSRPKGILFFAGPTGTGKTEMAKCITELIFGDPQQYIRFDMSEFSSEHSDARLIGAPPGYVGYDAGGELTKAIREKPASVVLFDEIEKASPRILDKFLQVLDDGRLTDGRGETAYFSESVIIFTSNLGMYKKDAHGERKQHVTSEENYEEVEKKVRKEIEDYFKYDLNRPELLNRFGDNIVVFNFISETTAGEIFENMLKSVVARVKEENAIDLIIPDEIKTQIKGLCVGNAKENGGRGIGNRLETVLTNPLARALFACPEGQQVVTIAAHRESQKGYEVVLS